MKDARYRILLIEDDKLDQTAFKRLVEEENLPYDWSIADSISEAKSTLSSERFDVIIVDFMLGDGTAFDVMELVKNTPIIFITGAGDEEIAVKAQRAGAYDYLIKDSEQNYLKALPITVTNAAKHKETVEELRLLSGAIMNTYDSVYITDMEDRIIFVNKAFCKNYGYKRDDIIGEDRNSLWIGNHHIEQMKNVPQIGGSSWQVGFYNQRKDGSIFPVSLSTSVIQDENGNEIAIVGVARDISDRILIEDELKTANQKLKQQNLMRGELAIMVSETLRRLLADNHIDKAKEVVSTYLDITKIDMDKMNLKMTKFCITSAFSEVVQALSPLASQNNIDINIFAPNSNAVIEADYNRIIQVLTNIMNITIERAPSNSCINVQVQDTGNKITVEVQDDGPTIGGSETDRMFNLFAQIKERPPSDKQGLVLSLPLTRQLVEMHGGRIWAESGDEQGNSFCFTLPKSSRGEVAAFMETKAVEKLCMRS
jgi:PAS domain S-box-containing protein